MDEFYILVCKSHCQQQVKWFWLQNHKLYSQTFHHVGEDRRCLSAGQSVKYTSTARRWMKKKTIAEVLFLFNLSNN